MSRFSITVSGQITDPFFFKAVSIGRALERLHYDEVKVEYNQFFETQWSQFLKKTANKLKGVFYQHDESKPLIFINDTEYIGDADQFSQWALYTYAYQDKDGLNAYTKMAKDAQIETFNHAKNRDYAKMDLTHSGESGVVVFELFTDIAPKTCANFLGLCEGFRKTADSEVMSYEGSEVHRIVPGMFLQAGRIANHTQASIHDGEFPDESFHVKHTEIGLLGMCKRSGLKHTNESQFYITMGAPLTFLDNQNVVFGRVIFGMEVLKQIERLETINEKAANTIVRITKAERYRAME